MLYGRLKYSRTVPENSGIEGNIQADLLVKLRSEHLFVGPEPALGVSKCLLRKGISKCIMQKQAFNWANYTRNRQGKLFIDEPTTKSAENLSSTNREMRRHLNGCAALARKKRNILGSHLMEPIDFSLHIIRKLYQMAKGN